MNNSSKSGQLSTPAKIPQAGQAPTFAVACEEDLCFSRMNIGSAIGSDKSTPDTPCLKRRSSSQRQREENKRRKQRGLKNGQKNAKSDAKPQRGQLRKLTLGEKQLDIIEGCGDPSKDGGYNSDDNSGDDTSENPINPYKHAL